MIITRQTPLQAPLYGVFLLYKPFEQAQGIITGLLPSS